MTQKEKEIIDYELTKSVLASPSSNSDGARKVNSKKYPDGYIYIIKVRGQNIYKIGVSQKPKRRIYDIDSASPFGVFIVCVCFFKNVYNTEEMIHDSFKDNLIRKEWFRLSDEEIKLLKVDIINMSNNGEYLTRVDTQLSILD